MQLLSIWNNLSDKVVEMLSNNLKSTIWLYGLKIEDDVPDYSTLSRFQKDLTEKKVFNKIMK
ncbi:MAG TPA: transposase [Saprospiraceae bacterium]|nr:transposase [Saprospiraceae bacterium]HQU95165.1 transposase [Saprospiraceae bacterium]HQW94424.1 transposase [Saprospiraceae bacterium]